MIPVRAGPKKKGGSFLGRDQEPFLVLEFVSAGRNAKRGETTIARDRLGLKVVDGRVVFKGAAATSTGFCSLHVGSNSG